MARRKTNKRNLKERVYIVGEGITEQYYFKHLKRINQFNYVVKPRFFSKTSIEQIEKAVQNLLMGGVTVVCVFDADVAHKSQTSKKKFKQFLEHYQNETSLIICDSLPSIEFWFLLHFIRTNKYFQNSKAVNKELKKHINHYKKSKKFLENIHWVEKLSDNLEVAIKNATTLGKQEMNSYSNVYKAFQFIKT